MSRLYISPDLNTFTLQPVNRSQRNAEIYKRATNFGFDKEARGIVATLPIGDVRRINTNKYIMEELHRQGLVTKEYRSPYDDRHLYVKLSADIADSSEID